MGLSGGVAPDVYVSKNERNNSLSGPREMLYRGQRMGITEAVTLETRTRRITSLDLEAASKVDSGILIVFTGQKIFVLNFDEDWFFV